MVMILMYWFEVYVHEININIEALAVVSKQTGLEVNANKTKYTVMSGEQNAG